MTQEYHVFVTVMLLVFTTRALVWADPHGLEAESQEWRFNVAMGFVFATLLSVANLHWDGRVRCDKREVPQVMLAVPNREINLGDRVIVADDGAPRWRSSPELQRVGGR